jgi:hypothetical protein
MLHSKKRKEGGKSSRKIVLIIPPGKRGDWLQRVIALKVLMP